MIFQLVWERDGVVLEVLTDMFRPAGRYEWVRLRKFWNEGDAKLFRDTRVPKMTENEVEMLARQYNAGDHVQRQVDENLQVGAGAGLELGWSWVGVGLELGWSWVGVRLELERHPQKIGIRIPQVR